MIHRCDSIAVYNILASREFCVPEASWSSVADASLADYAHAYVGIYAKREATRLDAFESVY